MSFLPAWPYTTVETIVDTANSDFAVATATASGTPNTKGAWSELIAATGRDAGQIVLVFGGTFGSTVDSAMLLDVGIGAAASETVIIPNLMVGFINGALVIPVPVFIPAGSRLAVRCQCATASRTIDVGARLYGGGRLGPPPFSGLVTAYGLNLSTSHGTIPGVISSANTKGTWAEITSGTSRDHASIMLGAQGIGNPLITRNHLVDIGIGAAGSEIVLVPDVYVATNANESVIGPLPQNVPLDASIPAGTRLAARCQAEGTSGAGVMVEVAVYGF